MNNGMPGITTKEMVITPQLADEWLERNNHNRKFSKANVAWLAKEIAAGKWKMNGVPIVFGASGRLRRYER